MYICEIKLIWRKHFHIAEKINKITLGNSRLFLYKHVHFSKIAIKIFTFPVFYASTQSQSRISFVSVPKGSGGAFSFQYFNQKLVCSLLCFFISKLFYLPKLLLVDFIFPFTNFNLKNETYCHTYQNSSIFFCKIERIKIWKIAE